MKVAIACVYYYDRDSEWIAKLQIEQIKRNSVGHDVKIFACFVKGSSKILTDVFGAPDTVLIESVCDSPNPSVQHSTNLDALLAEANEDIVSFDIIVTLDMDSFPIDGNWLEKSHDELKRSDIVSILRTENKDKFLTHPSFIAFNGEFLKKYSFQMFPDTKVLNSQTFKSFISKHNQRIDSGIGLSYLIFDKKLCWKKLTRKNLRSSHFLLEGVYGSRIYHLGASSRAPIFYHEIVNDFFYKNLSFLKKLPILWRLYFKFVVPLVEERIKKRNSKIVARVKKRLSTERDTYFATLLD